MLFKHVCLEAWSYTVPETILTSSQIEERLNPLAQKLSLPSGFFEIFTGIKERRIWDDALLPSDIGTKTAQKCLEQNKLKPADIDCLIHGSVSRDYLEPATAGAIHRNLGLSSSAMYFDLSNACLGLLNALFIMANFIENGNIKRGLVVGTESPGHMIDVIINKLLSLKNPTLPEASLYLPSLTLGGGSAAILLTHDSISQSRHKLLGGLSKTASQFNELCQAYPDTGLKHPVDNLFMKTEAAKLMLEATKLAKTTWGEFLDHLKWNLDDVAHIFSHQVGRMPREEMIKALGVSSNKDFCTYEKFGNMGSCALPITMAMGIEHRKPKPKDKISLMGFGSGINCLFLGIEW